MATRVRWKGLELPSRVIPAEGNSSTYGKFVIEPFERGLGTTIGNSLRRVLLSAIEGAAVTKVKISNAPHEFTTVPGVQEDVTDIILNIKNLVVALEGDEPKTMTLGATGPGEVTAELIEADTSITVLNKSQIVATLTDAVDFDIDFTVEKGRGYVPASDLAEREEERQVGIIHVDAIFSPVLRVRYKVEDTRVGQRTNYDKLTLEIWTNGAVHPENALVEAGKILRKHLNPFVMYFEIGSETISAEAAAAAEVEDEDSSKLDMPISDLDLSVRASNCLDSAGIRLVRDLVRYNEQDLLKIRSFGKTSLREIKRKLSDMNLSLAAGGAVIDDGFDDDDDDEETTAG
jgi:DNA-directed RNA polymerase subunit alpha